MVVAPRSPDDPAAATRDDGQTQISRAAQGVPARPVWPGVRGYSWWRPFDGGRCPQRGTAGGSESRHPVRRCVISAGHREASRKDGNLQTFATGAPRDATAQAREGAPYRFARSRWGAARGEPPDFVPFLPQNRYTAERCRRAAGRGMRRWRCDPFRRVQDEQNTHAGDSPKRRSKPMIATAWSICPASSMRNGSSVCAKPWTGSSTSRDRAV